MHGDPSPDAHADRSDLGFAGRRVDPDADPTVDRAGCYTQLGKGIDQPVFQRMDKLPDVAPALFEVELDIADALSGAMIGIAPAATGSVNREASVEQLVRRRAGAGGIERRM